jgi:hypothetical protein
VSFGERLLYKAHAVSKESLSAGINVFEARVICMAPCTNPVEKEVGTSSFGG